MLTDGISAGAHFDGGCGRDFERTDLAGDLAGSGGLQTAATTEEEFTAADRQGGHVSSNKAGTTSNGTGNSTCSGTGSGTGGGTDSGTARQPMWNRTAHSDEVGGGGNGETALAAAKMAVALAPAAEAVVPTATVARN